MQQLLDADQNYLAELNLPSVGNTRTLWFGGLGLWGQLLVFRAGRSHIWAGFRLDRDIFIQSGLEGPKVCP